MTNRDRVQYFNATEAASVIGIPRSTLTGSWAQPPLAITPSIKNTGVQGEPRLYYFGDLLRGKLAKRMLEGGLTVKAAGAVCSEFQRLIDEDVTKQVPFGGLIATGQGLTYLPRKNWDDPESFNSSIAKHKSSFAWYLDLDSVTQELMRDMWPITRQHMLRDWGVCLEPIGEDGQCRITIRDGYTFEGSTFDEALRKMQAHLVKQSLLKAGRYSGMEPAEVDEIEDLAKFVGYHDEAEFAEDIAKVRKTLFEVQSQKV